MRWAAARLSAVPFSHPPTTTRPPRASRRATYRFATPQRMNIQWGLFASPRGRTLAYPKIRVLTKNAGSTWTRTFDFVRLRARAVSRRGRWREALALLSPVRLLLS